MSSIAIEVHNLSKFYGKNLGIESVNLSINKGEIFGFIGPNGSGKSTAIRAMMGLLIPSSGRINILGFDAQTQGVEARKRVGYLPSEVNYYSEMNAREILEYHAKIYRIPNPQPLIEEKAGYFELDLDKPIDDLSFGNKKKCAIIQAVLHNPEVLILDEPTGGLDPLMQNRFFELMEDLNNQGTTLFFSSHILSEIQRLCDRAAIIQKGKIKAVEDIHALLAKQMKKVRLISLNDEDFNLPEGADNYHKSGRKHNFDYIGKPDGLIHWLSQRNWQDVSLTEPDLESIFMNYYQR